MIINIDVNLHCILIATNSEEKESFLFIPIPCLSRVLVCI